MPAKIGRELHLREFLGRTSFHYNILRHAQLHFSTEGVFRLLYSALQHLPTAKMFKNDLMNGVDKFVRKLWDPQPRYDDQSGTPIWFLGKEYSAGPPPKPVSTTDHDDVVEVESSTESHDPSESAPSTTDDTPLNPPQTGSFEDTTHIEGENLPSLSNDPSDGGWPHAFLDDFESRIWMTYRSSFPPIPRSQDPAATAGMTFAVRLRSLADKEGFSTDTGWGCMIRSGQSLLANALVILQLGRDWRRRRDEPTNPEKSIVSLFADDPKAPFSIHRFVQHGATACGKHPGQWFGPSATASCIKELSAECAAAGLRVYVTPNTSDVYEDRFRSISTSGSQGRMKPTLILLGIRLGPDRITPVYYEALKSCLTYPQSIGIAGGRPGTSHYFVGCQGETFFYLDPHETRPALAYHSAPQAYTDEEIASVHTRRLRTIKIGEMDPSMLIGFLIKDEADWEDWKQKIHEVKGKAIVHVYAKEPPVPGETKEREGAVDEVETFDDEEDDGTSTEVDVADTKDDI
jgi:cysteine protease ATG4